MDTQAPDRGQVFVLAVRDFLILNDLDDTIRDFDPLAMVVTLSDLDTALERIRSFDRITLAFLEAGPARLAASGLDTALAERQGRIVLLGDEAEDEWEAGHRRWPTLLRPFSTGCILAQITGEVRRAS
jgi:hypothetical protein